MTNHARNGAARERRVRDYLAERGWLPVMRAAGSKGAADLLLAHPLHGAALVQVGTIHKSLGPADRARFCHAATMCGALSLLAVATRTGIRFWLVTLDKPSTWTEFTDV